MALNFTTATASKALFGDAPKALIITPKNKDNLKLYQTIPSSSSSSYSIRAAPAAAQSEGRRVTEEEQEERESSASVSSDDSGVLRSARVQLDLLEQLTSSSSGSSTAAGYESDSGSFGKGTIREQLARLVGNRDDDFSIPLGKDLKKVSPKFLTTSQKRNIKRQTYLNEVSKRNDSVFFATIGAFVILPPFVILGIAIATGYVQLFP